MTWDKDSIKELRLKLGLTQTEFAYKLGCRQQTVSEWELGLYVPGNAYGRLLAAMEVENKNNGLVPQSSSMVSEKLKSLVENARAQIDDSFDFKA